MFWVSFYCVWLVKVYMFYFEIFLITYYVFLVGLCLVDIVTVTVLKEPTVVDVVGCLSHCSIKRANSCGCCRVTFPYCTCSILRR